MNRRRPYLNKEITVWLESAHAYGQRMRRLDTFKLVEKPDLTCESARCHFCRFLTELGEWPYAEHWCVRGRLRRVVWKP